MMEDLLGQLRAEAGRRGLRGALCVVAVSGGPDSVALWHLLQTVAPSLDMRLHLCHVDHGWRPDAAREEAGIAREMALAAGAGYSIIHLPPPARRSEDAARDARLSALARVARSFGAGAVALGHQQDDQAETVLMQLLRGSASVAGMPSWRAPFWRPLLSVPKERLLALCREEGLRFSLDETNFADGNLRARLRQGVLPLLRRENPGVAAAIARNALLRQEDEALLAAQAQALAQGLPALPGGVDLRPLREADGAIARRSLRGVLAQRGVTAESEVVLGLLEALRDGRRTSVGRGVRLEGGVLFWGTSRPDAVALRDGMRARFGEIWVGIGDPPEGAICTAVPQGDAVVRARLPGDRIRTPHGTRKLQDILVDEKVARYLRDLVPILIIDRVPFWVIGQPWTVPSPPPAERLRTAWAAPSQVVTSLWSVLK